jgi:hypothetical protein
MPKTVIGQLIHALRIAKYYETTRTFIQGAIGMGGGLYQHFQRPIELYTLLGCAISSFQGVLWRVNYFGPHLTQTYHPLL